MFRLAEVWLVGSVEEKGDAVGCKMPCGAGQPCKSFAAFAQNQGTRRLHSQTRSR